MDCRTENPLSTNWSGASLQKVDLSGLMTYSTVRSALLVFHLWLEPFVSRSNNPVLPDLVSLTQSGSTFTYSFDFTLLYAFSHSVAVQLPPWFCQFVRLPHLRWFRPNGSNASSREGRTFDLNRRQVCNQDGLQDFQTKFLASHLCFLPFLLLLHSFPARPDSIQPMSIQMVYTS